RWSHILRCLTESLTSKYGFAELCFQCDQWVTSADAWSSHCQNHLDDVDSLPIQLNPITFRKTLATVGQCPFCLFNSDLPPEIRFKQFLYAQSWKAHINNHFDDLE
ncbi:hypothetical protein F5884DRAFT_623630, partial [Xylogone sp. PMI_703]